jgi:hypothetical protein
MDHWSFFCSWLGNFLNENIKINVNVNILKNDDEVCMCLNALEIYTCLLLHLLICRILIGRHMDVE